MKERIILGPPKYEELMAGCVHQLCEAGYEVVANETGKELDHSFLEKYSKGCVGVIAGSEKWGARELTVLPELRAIVKCGAGVDNIDLDAARNMGIRVANSAGMNSNAVAEFCVGLILSLLRHIHLAAWAMNNGERPLLTGYELRGKKVGIVGMGHIGRLVAKKLSAFEAACFYYDPFVSSVPRDAVAMSSLEELVSSVDIVTLHMPASPETDNLIDDHLLSRFHPGSFLVNAARGSLVDEEALARAIDDGRIRGAALDVQKNERVGASNVLAGNKKVLLTPHLGAESFEAYDRVGGANAQDLINLLNSDNCSRQLV